MDYSGLKTKKYCSDSHSSRIEVLCTKDGTLCCADCAADHSGHLDQVIEIKSIFEKRQADYRQLKMKLKILSKMQSSPDEIRSYVAQLLESSFDQIIARVADMKAQWIEENFSRIIDSLGVDLEQNVPDLITLTNELEDTFKMIHNFVNSDEVNSEEVMNLKQPEEFQPKIEEILQTSNIRRKYKDIQVNLQFDMEAVKKMINIEGMAPIIPENVSSVFKKEDLDYALSLLPPIRELKMLYSGKRDEFNVTTFHNKCDGVGDTLVLVKSNNGYTFGGFAKPPWHSNGSFSSEASNSCFLFTCRNKTKHILTQPQNVIYGNKDWGPLFGNGDLHIQSNNNCYIQLGNSYSIPVGGKKEDYLCGPDGTNIEDYEVHQVIFQ